MKKISSLHVKEKKILHCSRSWCHDEVIVALEGGVFSSLHTFSIVQIEELLTQAHFGADTTICADESSVSTK